MNMEKMIELEKKMISYTLRQSRRARGISLCVASGGVFTVTAGPSVREREIDDFILKKSAWVLDKIKYFSKFPKKIFVKSKKKHFAEYKERARALIQGQLMYFNQVYGFKWNRVAIRNQRSRWGSCSRVGNLNFNYKLALLPPHLADYVIVHELCHLKEQNHSAQFWTLVAETLPNHRALRTELRRIGMSLL